MHDDEVMSPFMAKYVRLKVQCAVFERNCMSKERIFTNSLFKA